MGGINRLGNQVNFDNNRPEPVIKKVEVKVQTVEVAFKDSKTGESSFQASMLKAQLTKAFNPQVLQGAPPQVDQAKVDDALKTIREKLDESGWFNDVTHSELKDIQNTLQNLNGAEANQVIANLKPEELKKFADELGSSGWFGTGGFDATEKKEFLNSMAGKLDAGNLAKLATALNTGDAAGEENMRVLSQSIAENTSPQVKADFVKAMAGQVESTSSNGLAVANVIASLKNNPAELKQAIDGLSDSQLKAVMRAATQERIEGNSTMLLPSSPNSGFGNVNTTRRTFNPEPLKQMLEAVATSDDPKLKARVFDAGANQLKELEDYGDLTKPGNLLIPSAGVKESAQTIRQGLTSILDSDTSGIITRLEKTNNAKGLTSYMKSMLNNDEGDKVHQFVNRLTTGDASKTPTENIEQNSGTATKPIYQNARNLGFLAGSIYSATRQITSDTNKQADVIKNIFGAVLGAGGAANPASGVAASLANGLTAEAARNIVDQINSGTVDLRQGLLRLTLPPDASGDPYSGTAKEAYNGSFSATALQNGFD